MHRSVLRDEAVAYLNIRPNGRYVDGTLGAAGHAVAIAEKLGPDGRLLAVDADAGAVEAAKTRLQPFGEKAQTRRANFRGLQSVLREVGWAEIDGLLLDLGVSSDQLDDPSRGLSFQQAGPLDMRLDRTTGETAAQVVLRRSEEELASALIDAGEARHARKLARRLRDAAAAGGLATTADLANVCARTIGRSGRIHPATRTFMALRILVNDELGALQSVLDQAPMFLAVGGRLAVISFHSGEDRIVKSAFRRLASEGTNGRVFQILTKKPVEPGDAEQEENPRARSAKLRALERVS